MSGSGLATPRSLLGLLMVGVSLVLTAWAAYHLFRTGSCASGGAYVIANPCPPGTGGQVLGLMGGILLALAGTFVAGSFLVGIMWFGLFFTVLGSTAILTAVGPASPPGDVGGMMIMGIVFVATMGIPVIGVAFWMAGKASD